MSVTFADLPTSGLWSAHRTGGLTEGYNRGIAPDTTLVAIEQMINLGASMVDVDIRAAADGVLVGMHDDTVDWTTLGTGRVADYPSHQMPLIEPIWYGENYRGTHVPTMAEICATFGGKVVFTFEAKEPAQLDKMVELICKHGMQNSAMINTGTLEVAQAVKAKGRGMLLHYFGLATQAAVDIALAVGADVLELYPYNCSQALADYAMQQAASRPEVRVIGGPRGSRFQHKQGPTGLHGFVSDAPGYLERNDSFVRSLVPAIASQRIGAGWRRVGAITGIRNGGIFIPPGGGVQLGDMCGSLPVKGQINVKFKFLSGAGTIGRTNFRFLSDNDGGSGMDNDSGNDYICGLRGNGELCLWRAPAVCGGGTHIGGSPLASPTIALNQEVEIAFGWNNDAIALTRVDQANRPFIGWVGDKTWRGDYFWIGAVNADILVTSVIVTAT